MKIVTDLIEKIDKIKKMLPDCKDAYDTINISYQIARIQIELDGLELTINSMDNRLDEFIDKLKS